MTCSGKLQGHNFIQVGGDCSVCGVNTYKLIEKPKYEKKDIYKGKKIKHSYQELGVDMSTNCKGNVWWIFHKYPENVVRQAYKVCTEKGIYSISYLISVIKNILKLFN